MWGRLCQKPFMRGGFFVEGHYLWRCEAVHLKWKQSCRTLTLQLYYNHIKTLKIKRGYCCDGGINVRLTVPETVDEGRLLFWRPLFSDGAKSSWHESVTLSMDFFVSSLYRHNWSDSLKYWQYSTKYGPKSLKWAFWPDLAEKQLWHNIKQDLAKSWPKRDQI